MEQKSETHNGTGSVAQSFPMDLDQARRRFEDLNRQALRFIRERPGACLVGALAFGFVIGRLASRR